MGDTGVPPAARGRAALLEKLRKRAEATVGVPPEGEEKVAPKPTGRAAFLKQLQESRAAAAKIGVQATTSQVALKSEPSKEAPTSREEPSGVRQLTSKLETCSITPEAEKVLFKGTAGKPVRLSANYVKLSVEKNRGVFEYEVKFEPQVDAKFMRNKLVHARASDMGKTKMFDGGAVLYLPKRLDVDVTTFECELPNGDPVTMSVIYKRKRSLAECLHLYNVLFKRIMKVLLYKQMGKNYFNPESKQLIPQHKLEIYPGFAVTVDELEDGLLLCLDTQHRVLRSQNVLELMTTLKGARDFKQAFTSSVIGSVVLTRYNNNTYKIDDIAWDCSPANTFEGRGNVEMSFMKYYKDTYDIDIKNETQPLLIHRKSIKNQEGEKVDQMICLVPELSYLTGLSDAMRSDFKVMKDVAQFTRVTPQQRANSLRTYLRNVEQSPESQQILADWGLKLDTTTVGLEGRNLPPEKMFFGDNVSVLNRPNADWTRAVGENKVICAIDLRSWVVFYTARDEKSAERFVQLMMRLGDPMGCVIAKPKLVQLRDDRNENYIEGIKQHVGGGNVQCAVFICPTMRTDRYTVIKKMCCINMPIPSQVIMARNLMDERKSRTIVQKIALQINCKLGGSLWTVSFPFKNWMIIGVDVYHSGPASKGPKGSVCGFVVSLNDSMSRWFSVCLFQEGELGDFYKVAFNKALNMYKTANQCYPDRIVIFRDGVGDGQLEHCRRYEIPQFEDIIKENNLDIKLCFVIVQKRINTRMFAMNGQELANPAPGTILDHTVTRRHMKDFFLVPQNVNQGTVNPTHYIVIHDTCNMQPDHVQRLAFKLCHLYYNWSGTIRVPAPCLYAHKLASIVGQHLKTTPSAELCDKLFYL